VHAEHLEVELVTDESVRGQPSRERLEVDTQAHARQRWCCSQSSVGRRIGGRRCVELALLQKPVLHDLLEARTAGSPPCLSSTRSDEVPEATREAASEQAKASEELLDLQALGLARALHRVWRPQRHADLLREPLEPEVEPRRDHALVPNMLQLALEHADAVPAAGRHAMARLRLPLDRGKLDVDVSPSLDARIPSDGEKRLQGEALLDDERVAAVEQDLPEHARVDVCEPLLAGHDLRASFVEVQVDQVAGSRTDVAWRRRAARVVHERKALPPGATQNVQ
jgi:hypothetical protein